MIECDRMNMMMMMTMRNGSCCLCCVIVLGDDDDDENNGNDGTRVIGSRVVDDVGVDDALVVGNNLYILVMMFVCTKKCVSCLVFGSCETLFQIFIDPRCCVLHEREQEFVH